MKNFLIAIAVFLIWSVFGLWLYSWIQRDTESIIASSNADETEIINEENENIKDVSDKEEVLDIPDVSEDKSNGTFAQGLTAVGNHGDLIFSFAEGISTKLNSAEIVIPSNLKDFKYKLYIYSMEHPDEELHIESLYSPKENLMNPNLGMRRGEKLKTILTGMGIAAENIVIRPVINGINTNDTDWVNNCIQFTYKTLNEERLKTLRSTPKGKIIYPKYNNSGIVANTELKELLIEIKGHVSNNPDLMIEIIGHTDNIGNGLDNYRMGLKYARQIRWYLIKKGEFDPKMIVASSKGEEEPIESNNTSAGRTANRRIEVKYK